MRRRSLRLLCRPARRLDTGGRWTVLCCCVHQPDRDRGNRKLRPSLRPTAVNPVEARHAG